MNNYRNYGNCGNNSVRMMQNKAMMKAESDCGCMKPGMTKPDCGCVKPGMTKPDCGCMDKEEKPDCGCKGKEEKPDYNCGCQDRMYETCGCKAESMYREEKCSESGCEGDMPGKALAMSYVPWQGWKKLYEVCEGFATGTIFKELDLEFLGRRCN